jgi:hypothetical protein
MRWFKHITVSWEDEKMATIVSEFGLEGYGFWWRLLEIVAYYMDGSDRCSIAFPLSKWSHLFYCHHNKVSNYLSKLEVMGLVKLKYNGSKPQGNIEVTIPNLLKYRDEYSKKSRQTPDKLLTNS